MIEQPQAPKVPYQEQTVPVVPLTNEQSNHGDVLSHSNVEFETLLREVKQLRQDVQFLKQLLEHVQSQLP